MASAGDDNADQPEKKDSSEGESIPVNQIPKRDDKEAGGGEQRACGTRSRHHRLTDGPEWFAR